MFPLQLTAVIFAGTFCQDLTEWVNNFLDNKHTGL